MHSQGLLYGLCRAPKRPIDGRVGLYVIVCLNSNCAAGCNQEPVQVIVAQVVSPLIKSNKLRYKFALVLFRTNWNKSLHVYKKISQGAVL